MQPFEAPSPVIEELRQLFARGEHESVLVRAENLQKRKKYDDHLTKQVINAVKAASLIHLGRAPDALTILNQLPSPIPSIEEHVLYAKLYATWAVNENIGDAIGQLSELKSTDARRLEAQLLYRAGRYAEAAERYAQLLNEAKATLEEKKRPAAASRWALSSMTGRSKEQSAPITASELDQLNRTVNELATNTMAAFVLSRGIDSALEINKELRASYELEYNAACALIARDLREDAETSLEKAEALIRAELDDEEDDIEEVIAPVHLQKTYLKHLAGEVETAEKSYAGIIAQRKADAGSLAVAANNLTVALGQLAFGKQGDTGKGAWDATAQKTLPKEQHDALAEGLKKMKATSGRNVERKLTMNQRRAMARNRAILLVQMGRVDACRTELAKVKSDFPDDPIVPLIEATLVARQSNLETADKILQHAGGGQNLAAARIQLAASQGEYQRAVKLLQEAFPAKPAAVVTAATLLEQNGDVEGALKMLRSQGSSVQGPAANAAKKALAKMLLRNDKYEEAANVLREVCAANSQDSFALAQLAVATSYFDPEEAANVVERLPDAKGYSSSVDVQQLEALPPPKRKHVANKANRLGANAVDDAERAASAKAAAARERKKRKRKKRLPKNYDPDGPPPDPERWLPKTMRSGYKKKKTKNDQKAFRGAQGADAAAADAAAQKNAEKSAAKAAAAAAEGPLPPSGRSKLQRKKKNRR